VAKGRGLNLRSAYFDAQGSRKERDFHQQRRLLFKPFLLNKLCFTVLLAVHCWTDTTEVSREYRVPSNNMLSKDVEGKARRKASVKTFGTSKSLLVFQGPDGSPIEFNYPGESGYDGKNG